jgi:Fic family protein
MLNVKLTDEDLIRKLGALAVAERGSVHAIAERYLRQALEAVPMPAKAPPAFPATMTRPRAVDRNADTVLGLLLDQPSLTVRQVEQTTGWSRPTVIAVLRHMLDEGLLARTPIATGGAPAFAYHLPPTVSR